ncbi:larval cuticle protein 65Ag1-like [Drosophila tropicalis]|uniref:larval cuticle protein 65Ag1-like n=1 Tax=Drosophila tropicalis TaxID=46794 RepID=UPI0035ABF966
MKFVIVFVALIALTYAAPPSQEAQVLRQDSQVGPSEFSHILEINDGTAIQAQGHLENEGKENASIAVSGSYKYVADDGITYQVDYIADKNGYQPSGAHLPIA